MSELAGRSGEENTFPQEGEARPAKHLPFEHLDPIDMAFDDARVSRQGESSDDGGQTATCQRSPGAGENSCGGSTIRPGASTGQPV